MAGKIIELLNKMYENIEISVKLTNDADDNFSRIVRSIIDLYNSIQRIFFMISMQVKQNKMLLKNMENLNNLSHTIVNETTTELNTSDHIKTSIENIFNSAQAISQSIEEQKKVGKSILNSIIEILNYTDSNSIKFNKLKNSVENFTLKNDPKNTIEINYRGN